MFESRLKGLPSSYVQENANILLQSLEEQFPCKEGHQISSCTDFKFNVGNSTPHIKVVTPSECCHYDIAMEPTAAKVTFKFNIG